LYAAAVNIIVYSKKEFKPNIALQHSSSFSFFLTQRTIPSTMMSDQKQALSQSSFSTITSLTRDPHFTSLQEITEMRDFFTIPIFFNFITYLFYRVLRSIILLESDLWVVLKRFTNGNKIIELLNGQKPPTASAVSSPTTTNGSPKYGNNNNSDDCQNVEIMTIVARKKLHKSDVSRDVDFMLFHSEFQPFSILESSKWQLYSITLNYAYFVEMPFPSTEYTFKFCDTLSEGLFMEAQRVARVDWNTFEIKSDKWRHFKGKVISLTTMLHSGSSTLCSLLQQVCNGLKNLMIPFIIPNLRLLMKHQIQIHLLFIPILTPLHI
jgi:hypothetical protein